MKQKLTARDIQSYIKLVVWVFVIAYLCFSSGSKFDNLNIDTIIPEWLLPLCEEELPEWLLPE